MYQRRQRCNSASRDLSLPAIQALADVVTRSSTLKTLDGMTGSYFPECTQPTSAQARAKFLTSRNWKQTTPAYSCSSVSRTRIWRTHLAVSRISWALFPCCTMVVQGKAPMFLRRWTTSWWSPVAAIKNGKATGQPSRSLVHDRLAIASTRLYSFKL